MASEWGNHGNSDELFSWAQKSLRMVTATMKLKESFPLEEKLWKIYSVLKKWHITLLTKVWFYSVVRYTCECWTVKKPECWRIAAFKLWYWRILLRVPWTARRPVNPKGDQYWIFIARTDTEAEASLLWPPDVKSQLIGKDLDPGKDWGQEEKGVMEDETVG